jgi:hypothetical protein
LKKILFFILITLFLSTNIFAVDADKKKISELTESTSITDDDLLIMVDAPATAPTTKRITFDNFKTSLGADIGNLTTGDVNVGTEAEGHNLIINSTLGPEMVPAFSAENWTATNYFSISDSTIVKSSGYTSSTITPSGTFTVTPGKIYKIVITVSAVDVSPVFSSVEFYLGGYAFFKMDNSTLPLYNSPTTVTKYIKAGNSDKLNIISYASCTITISSISIKELQTSTGDFTVFGDLKIINYLKNVNGEAIISFREDNNFIGRYAGYNLGMGVRNTGIGNLSLYNITTGSSNTGIGASSLNSTTTGTYNTSIGAFSLVSNTTGTYNVGLGPWAGQVFYTSTGSSGSLKSPTYGIYIGYSPAGASNTETNAIVIGKQTRGKGSNTVVIGNTSTTNTYLQGITTYGTTGGYVRKVAEATATLSGATTDIALAIPTNSKLLGVQFRVGSTITSGDGGTTWNASYSGGSTTSLVTGQSFTSNTKVNKMHVDEVTSAETNITITPDSGTFSGGEIRAIVYYETFVTLDDYTPPT